MISESLRQHPVSRPERVPTLKPLSAMQLITADMLGLRMSYADIGLVLKIQPVSVRRHARGAARKIPGDLPAQVKVVAWARGASLDVLEGHSLRYYVQSRVAIEKEQKARKKARQQGQQQGHSDRAIAAVPTDPSSQPALPSVSPPASEHT